LIKTCLSCFCPFQDESISDEDYDDKDDLTFIQNDNTEEIEIETKTSDAVEQQS
jgi:hypothetical protein